MPSVILQTSIDELEFGTDRKNSVSEWTHEWIRSVNVNLKVIFSRKRCSYGRSTDDHRPTWVLAKVSMKRCIHENLTFLEKYRESKANIGDKKSRSRIVLMILLTSLNMVMETKIKTWFTSLLEAIEIMHPLEFGFTTGSSTSVLPT